MWSPSRQLWAVFLLIFLCNLPGLRFASDVSLVQDPDTGLIVAAIRQDASLRGLASWFVRDWPLENRFYRPLVVLSLAVDNALWGDWARGYRLTSWLLSVATAWGVFCWFLWLTSRRTFGLAAAFIFSLRQAGLELRIPAPLLTLLGALALFGFARGRTPHRRTQAHSESGRRLVGGSVVIAAGIVVALEWQTNETVISWIAARTALLGAFFSVWCLAFFARFCRGSGWAPGVLAVVLEMAALGSYEQSVMVPLAAVAMLLWTVARPPKQVAIALVALFLVLGLYGVLRASVVGTGLSGYHLQQLKSSAVGAVREMLRYLLPPYYLGQAAWVRLGGLPWALFDGALWFCLVAGLCWIVAFWNLLLRAPRAGIALYLMKGILFLPMAALHVFPHYYYLPEAASAAWSAALLWPEGTVSPGNTAGDRTASPNEVSERAARGGEKRHALCRVKN